VLGDEGYWHPVQDDLPDVRMDLYSLRYPGNGDFPFRALDALVRAAHVAVDAAQ
jgi:hypothetical protein